MDRTKAAFIRGFVFAEHWMALVVVVVVSMAGLEAVVVFIFHD